MTLLAAFQLLLSKYAGSDDVVVGSPVAGRTRREVEGVIGFFANTLAPRTDRPGDPACRRCAPCSAGPPPAELAERVKALRGAGGGALPGVVPRAREAQRVALFPES